MKSTEITQSLKDSIAASIERTKLNASTIASCRAYLSKREPVRKLNVSALAASLERGKSC